MKKWIMIMLTMLLCFPIVQGLVQVQISTDNTTWTTVENITYGGSIDETERLATAFGLDESTTYYLRAKDSTTSWGYESFNTEGDDTMSFFLGIIMFGVIISCIACLIIFRDNMVGFISAGLMLLLVFPLSFHVGALIIGGSGVVSEPYATDLVNIFDTFYYIGLRFFILGISLSLFYLMYRIVSNVKLSGERKRQKRIEREEAEDLL